MYVYVGKRANCLLVRACYLCYACVQCIISLTLILIAGPGRGVSEYLTIDLQASSLLVCTEFNSQL